MSAIRVRRVLARDVHAARLEVALALNAQHMACDRRDRAAFDAAQVAEAKAVERLHELVQVKAWTVLAPWGPDALAEPHVSQSGNIAQDTDKQP